MRRLSIEDQLEKEIEDLQWTVDQSDRSIAALMTRQARLSSVLDRLLGPGSAASIANGQTSPIVAPLHRYGNIARAGRLILFQPNHSGSRSPQDEIIADYATVDDATTACAVMRAVCAFGPHEPRVQTIDEKGLL